MIEAPHLSPAAIAEQARQAFSSATAVVDAEVVEPMAFGDAWKPGLQPVAALRVLRRYKGSVTGIPDLVEVAYTSSCDIALTRRGERVRLLLNEGPRVFYADQGQNAGTPDSDAAIDRYLAEIDRLVGTERPKGFARLPGTPPEPN